LKGLEWRAGKGCRGGIRKSPAREKTYQEREVGDRKKLLPDFKEKIERRQGGSNKDNTDTQASWEMQELNNAVDEGKASVAKGM